MNSKKNIFYLFIIAFFVTNHAFSQNNSSPNTIPTCEVTLIDGTKQQGEITSFLEKLSRIDGDEIWYTSPEKLYNLTDREFTFKSAQDNTTKIYKQRDVKEVKLLYGEKVKPMVYRVMELKYLNEYGEIKESGKTVWLPVYKEYDDITLFSVDLWRKNIYRNPEASDRNLKKGRKLFTITYISNNRNNYVFALNHKSYDGDLSIRKRTKINTVNAFKQIFNECPQFIAKIIKNDKFDKRIYKLSSSENKKKISKVKHDKSLSKREKEMIIDELRLDIDNELYVKLVEDYIATCKS